MADDRTFEIPPELQVLAERNVEQARAAYGVLMNLLMQAMVASSKTPNPFLPAFEPIQQRAIEFANENAERFFVLAGALAQAKNIQTVLSLESHYAQSQM